MAWRNQRAHAPAIGFRGVGRVIGMEGVEPPVVTENPATHAANPAATLQDTQETVTMTKAECEAEKSVLQKRIQELEDQVASLNSAAEQTEELKMVDSETNTMEGRMFIARQAARLSAQVNSIRYNALQRRAGAPYQAAVVRVPAQAMYRHY